jgi:soluble lytic murein transglycosylase-like protein
VAALWHFAHDVLQLLRKHRWIALVVAVVLIAGTIAIVVVLRRPELTPEMQAAGDLPAAPEAPPDLEKFRETYASGLAALQKKDGEEAVKQLASFDFGTRAVEQYRLYHLGNAYEFTKNTAAARATYAKLWRGQPRLVHADDAARRLATLYANAGDFRHAADVHATLANRSANREVVSSARWSTVTARVAVGDIAGAFYAARNILIHNPGAKEADEALKFVRAVAGLGEKDTVPLTARERLLRAIALMGADKPQDALEELTALEPVAPAALKNEVRLQRGIALHRLKKYEDSTKVLEPLTSGEYKIAIPALRHLSRNYSIVSSAIDPTVYKTVKERKQVGTVKVRVGKGKKKKTVTRPKFQTVSRQVKLIDLAKKNKKDEYTRLSSERLKDLLQLPPGQLDDDTKLQVLTALAERAASKNQDGYVRELVPQIIKLDSNADPALQHFWDKAWAAYSRGDLGTAKPLFRWISDTYSHPNIKRQNDYWYARSIERTGQKEEAKAIYRRLAASPYADIYALHSVQRGAPRQENRTNPLEREGDDWRELAEKNMPGELRLAYELTALASMSEAQLEIRANEKRTNTRFAQALQADIYHAAGEPVLMYRAIRRAWPQLATPEQDTVPSYFIAMYYPRRYVEEITEHAEERKLDPHLVQALILQESYYNPKARSRVGATGLMQLMPPTAQEHARRLRIAFAKSRLENPDVNIQLGTFHLRMLIDMFRGNTYLALASYNGGQGNVMKWRRAAPSKPMDEFLESIPFPETRGYVKRITMMQSAYARLSL